MIIVSEIIIAEQGTDVKIKNKIFSQPVLMRKSRHPAELIPNPISPWVRARFWISYFAHPDISMPIPANVSEIPITLSNTFRCV